MGPLNRVENWPTRLAEVVTAWRGKRFVWGQSDCLGLCIASERAIWGVSRLDGLPPYDSEATAARGLVSLGFGSVAGLVSSRAAEVAPRMAVRGDWVMREGVGTLPGAFGVVLGEQAAHMGLDGLTFLPVISAAHAWRIA